MYWYVCDSDWLKIDNASLVGKRGIISSVMKLLSNWETGGREKHPQMSQRNKSKGVKSYHKHKLLEEKLFSLQLADKEYNKKIKQK